MMILGSRIKTWPLVFEVFNVKRSPLNLIGLKQGSLLVLVPRPSELTKRNCLVVVRRTSQHFCLQLKVDMFNPDISLNWKPIFERHVVRRGSRSICKNICSWCDNHCGLHGQHNWGTYMSTCWAQDLHFDTYEIFIFALNPTISKTCHSQVYT